MTEVHQTLDSASKKLTDNFEGLLKSFTKFKGESNSRLSDLESLIKNKVGAADIHNQVSEASA